MSTKKLSPSLLLTLISALLLANTSKAEDALQLRTDDLGAGVYMLSGVGGFVGGNMALSIGDDGVVLIDNGIPDVNQVLIEEIAKTTDKAIDYVINTHAHFDHTGNNLLFGDMGSKIISHDNLRAALVADEKQSGNAIPVLTFNDELTIHLNGDTLQLKHLAKAHTDGDAVIKFQNGDILHTGDIMFNGMFPFIDADGGGSLDGVIAALEAISAMSSESTKIIPGHGPIASKQDVEKTIAMLKDSKSIIAELVESGKSDEEILASSPLEKYQSYSWAFINTERMIKQLIRAARGKE